MNALFLLIALYTISGKQVESSGDVPAGATCAYEQTGSQSGQMTAGNSVTLTLNGYDGARLEEIKLTMHSNKEAGAGRLSLSMGSQALWTISDAAFNASAWAGTYSKEWLSITHSLGGTEVPENAPITLTITASKNSLYLQAVELTYSAAAPKSHTVTFATHVPEQVASMTEQQPQGGVLLPWLQWDDPTWQFIGWAEQGVVLSGQMPIVNYPGARYYPTHNCTLHAVYMQEGEFEPWLPAEEVQSGDYVIALFNAPTYDLWYATGAVTDGVLATVYLGVDEGEGYVTLPTNVAKSDAIYTLSVDGEQVSIRHKSTNSDVKLVSGGKLTKSSFTGSTWRLTPVEDDQVMQCYSLSGEVDGVTYYLSYASKADGSIVLCPTKDAQMQHELLLYNLDDFVDIPSLYTSYPLGNGIEATRANAMPTYRINMGAYTLTIRNGKKYLQINE